MDSLAITTEMLRAAREAFEMNEPRDLFYRAAVELVDLATQPKAKLTIAEALGVLLQTWNKAFYRFRPFTREHLCAIHDLVSDHDGKLVAFRKRSIDTIGDADVAAVKEMFNAFELVLGPVGAAKSLHLLAPSFFPLWDRAIAKAYGIKLREAGTNSAAFVEFMWITKGQVESLTDGAALGRNPLKAIDEYNYCKFTKKWIKT